MFETEGEKYNGQCVHAGAAPCDSYRRGRGESSRAEPRVRIGRCIFHPPGWSRVLPPRAAHHPSPSGPAPSCPSRPAPPRTRPPREFGKVTGCCSSWPAPAIAKTKRPAPDPTRASRDGSGDASLCSARGRTHGKSHTLSPNIYIYIYMCLSGVLARGGWATHESRMAIHVDMTVSRRSAPATPGPRCPPRRKGAPPNPPAIDRSIHRASQTTSGAPRPELFG